MNQPWSSLAVPPDAIIGVLNAVFQCWPDPSDPWTSIMKATIPGQPDTIYRCAAYRKKYGRPRQSHVEAQCMKRDSKTLFNGARVPRLPRILTQKCRSERLTFGFGGTDDGNRVRWLWR